ncbi:acyl-CoA synthetase [Streptomyces sp. NBC_01016]|uniref:acyl-CoA synthetase n=1 Tax=Streptomyces sp. NBC_01016 TaxID=2903720 RepID=UPI002258F49C|nr:acyl-CoA synthetase [Streptomyces sp. NBC_01016]MCX4831305.1 acyl-CoA synthetase [Streptomyces sp. NBC_01016]
MEPLTPRAHAHRTPDAPAVIMSAGPAEDMSGDPVGDTCLTFAELDDRSARLATALRAKGLKPGDGIALLMENHPAFFVAAWAAQRSGLRYTALNSHLHPAEAQYILDDCGARALIASERMTEVVAGLDLTRIPIRLCAVGKLKGWAPLDEAIAAYGPLPEPEESEGREMLYSSGTTGRPKGVRKELSHAPFGDPAAAPALIARGIAANGGGLRPGDVFLSPAPLYHSAPLVYSMSMQRLGVPVVLMDGFEPRQCLRLIAQHRVTQAQFVPTMFVRMLRLTRAERERHDVSSLRVVVHTGAPCPVPVKRQMIDWWGPIVHEYYAGTEDIGNTAITAEEWLAHPGSVGKPATACHIVDDMTGAELPPGHEGVVYFEGGRLFAYHNDPEKTASVTNAHGWRTLGDIGRLDEDGYLYLTDRRAHMIISGGVNVYPQEAENVLAGHPAVADVAVIGVPDPEMGEAVKAVVQPAEGASEGAELAAGLIAYCRAELAAYKCPRTVDFTDELPRDPNGKLYKRRLRERYWQGHDSRVI